MADKKQVKGAKKAAKKAPVKPVKQEKKTAAKKAPKPQVKKAQKPQTKKVVKAAPKKVAPAKKTAPKKAEVKKTAPKKEVAVKKAAPKAVKKEEPKVVIADKVAPKKAAKAEPKAKKEPKKELNPDVILAKKEQLTFEVKKGSKEIGSMYEISGRHYFTDDRSVAGIPNLLEIQLDSYNDFLKSGIDKVFKESFPISDFSGEKVDIYYKGFSLEEPKFEPEVCKRKNLNYEASLKVRLEMLNKETGEIKEQDVYMGGIPLMTDSATFVINGIERVIVNQIIRSTGVFFNLSDSGVTLKIIPAKGSWFEVDTEKRGVINVKIDKKRKIPISVLLRAFGLESNAEILDAFSDLGNDIVVSFV